MTVPDEKSHSTVLADKIAGTVWPCLVEAAARLRAVTSSFGLPKQSGAILSRYNVRETLLGIAIKMLQHCCGLPIFCDSVIPRNSS
jgi:hypothetical protein